MADNIEGSLYEVLGLDDFESDARVISLAYRRLARQYHPDRNSTKPQSEQDAAAERFQEVSHANDILGDADEKEA
jgi:curved DNA-binding protein CbpA